jgi:hypothetical protein
VYPSKTSSPSFTRFAPRPRIWLLRADLSGVGLVGIERFKMIVGVCQDVIEYTKDDNILRKIEIQGTGFIFRTLYGPISLAIPKYFREIIVFI